MRPFPVVLYGSEYWTGLLEWMRKSTLPGGYISEEDLGLLVLCDDIQHVVDTVHEWYDRQELSARNIMDEIRRRDSAQDDQTI